MRPDHILSTSALLYGYRCTYIPYDVGVEPRLELEENDVGDRHVVRFLQLPDKSLDGVVGERRMYYQAKSDESNNGDRAQLLFCEHRGALI